MTWSEKRGYFARKLEQTGCRIPASEPLDRIVEGLAQCVRQHHAAIDAAFLARYPDEPFIIAAVEEALRAVRSSPREFGIGAVLVEGDEVIARAHNSQLGRNRTDLHAEMTLMTDYEERTKAERKTLAYAPSLRLYSSTEPCPMCYLRTVIAGVSTYYGASSEEDGMAHLRDKLPHSWAAAARRVKCGPARSSPTINAIAEALFYSYARFEAFAHLK
ncbi:MAG: hypothetical protein JRI55_29190 [Deltaproteobacteria bacterium]|jgi:tRNA(Arg) A34 adenosine deaminase TadA|nr:hypothetical protein [Deltaproteobacteria bacterium]